MSKLPAFQFYPGDWMKDPGLRRCSHAAKGVLMDVLCLMFESPERGVLVTGGSPWTDEEIAAAIGGHADVTLTSLRELQDKGVLRSTNDGALYSARMVRDEGERTQSRLRKQNQRLREESRSSHADVTPLSHRSSSSSSSSISSSEDIRSAAEASQTSELLRKDEKGDETKNQRKSSRPNLTDDEFVLSLKSNPAYSHINIDSELGKMDAWLLVHPGRQKTRKFAVRWLNGIEKPLSTEGPPERVLATPSSRRLPTPDEAAKQWLEENQFTQENNQ